MALSPVNRPKKDEDLRKRLGPLGKPGMAGFGPGFGPGAGGPGLPGAGMAPGLQMDDTKDHLAAKALKSGTSLLGDRKDESKDDKRDAAKQVDQSPAVDADTRKAATPDTLQAPDADQDADQGPQDGPDVQQDAGQQAIAPTPQPTPKPDAKPVVGATPSLARKTADRPDPRATAPGVADKPGDGPDAKPDDAAQKPGDRRDQKPDDAAQGPDGKQDLKPDDAKQPKDAKDPGGDPVRDKTQQVAKDGADDAKQARARDDQDAKDEGGDKAPGGDKVLGPGGPVGADAGPAQAPAPSKTEAKPGAGGEPLMAEWMASHPHGGGRDNILKLATITDGVQGRYKEAHAEVKPGFWDKMGNAVSLGGAGIKLNDIVKAFRQNPFKGDLTSLEGWIGLIKVVRPIISTVGDVADKVGLITTIAALLTIWFPPVAGPLAAIGRIANIVSLVCKSADFLLGLMQSVLAAIRIGKEKDPLKRAQLASAMRDGIQGALMSGFDILTSKIGGKTKGGAATGAKRTWNLQRGAGRTVTQSAKSSVKGALTGAKHGLAKEFSKKGAKDLARQVGGEVRDLAGGNFKKLAASNLKKEWAKGLKEGAVSAALAKQSRSKFIVKTAVASHTAYGGIVKEGDLVNRVGAEYEATRSSARGASIRSSLAGGGGQGVDGYLGTLDSLIAAELNVKQQAGGAGGQGVVVPPAPTEADGVLQQQDYDGIESQQNCLREVAQGIDQDVKDQTQYRDDQLTKVAPEAVEGGKAAMDQANGVAEQKAENAQDKVALDQSRKGADQVVAANKDTQGQSQSAQGDANQGVAAAQQGMNAQPDESKVKAEAQKKAEEDYRKEKEEYDKSSVAGKIWKSIKKFAKSVFDFFAGALAWVWKNIVKAIVEKVKSVIAKVMNYITSVIMKFLLKMFGGMSDSEAQTLAFGAEADKKKQDAEKTDAEMDQTKAVAMQASDKASKTEKAAIEEGNKANENILKLNQIKQEVKGQQDALEQEKQAGKAREANFKAQFGPYFAYMAMQSKGDGGGAGAPGQPRTPVVTGPMVANLDAAAQMTNASSTGSANKFQADADEIRREAVKGEEERLKAALDSQKKANGKDGSGGAAGALGGAAMGMALGGPVGAVAGAAALGVRNPNQLDAGQYDQIYNDASSRIRNQALVFSREIVEKYRGTESDRRARVTAEGSKAGGYKGQDLGAVEAALRRIGQAIKTEHGAIDPAREDAKGQISKGYESMFK